MDFFLIFVKLTFNIKVIMKETIAQINAVVAALSVDLAKAEAGNKAAAARARKATLELEKLGKQFRKESIEAAK